MLVPLLGGKYGREEAQERFEALDKPGRGLIKEWNGMRIDGADAPAIFVCECGREFPTTGPTIMDPRATYNGCPDCSRKAMREANLKYDLESAKAAISRNQKRSLDLSRVTSFHSVHDRVDVVCEIHNELCENKHLWRCAGHISMRQMSCNMIGKAHAAGWFETEEEMRKVEGAHISYNASTYRSRQRKMLKHCSKEGHSRH